MEPAAVSSAAAVAPTYPDSADSSPRSRNTDSWDDPLYPSAPKVRLMCSYGGHIVPRPHDKSLCYVGGDTRIVVVDRHTSLSDLNSRLSKSLLHTNSFSLKYQLPNEDLDSLISLTTDEDLENMIDEYDRFSNKSSRLRIFLFPSKSDSASSLASLLENTTTKSQDWFLNALNGATTRFSDSASVNCLLDLDEDELLNNAKPNLSLKDAKTGAQDVHSVPDSPMLDTTSSFGSASSSPSLANLPPIRVQVEDPKLGIENQFSQLTVQHKHNDLGFGVLAAVPDSVSIVPVTQPPPPPQLHPNLPSPDSVSSEGSMTNPLSRQKTMIYQEPTVQVQPQPGQNRACPSPVDQKMSDPNPRIQMQQQQQLQDPGYLLQTQFDPQHHPQFHHQQTLQTQFNPQQQFIHAGTQYIQHHPTGAVPMASYYPVYPSQQQHHPHHPGHDPQYPVYYVPARQAPQGYNLSVQQPSYSEAGGNVPSNRNQTQTPAAAYNPARNTPAPKPEMASGVYKTATTAAPSVVQVQSAQHQPQYAGFSQMHHLSQSRAPTSAATPNYAYEFADPTQAHIYYTQALSPQMAAQYQTMTSALPETTAQQQVRTSQP